MVHNTTCGQSLRNKSSVVSTIILPIGSNPAGLLPFKSKDKLFTVVDKNPIELRLSNNPKNPK